VPPTSRKRFPTRPRVSIEPLADAKENHLIVDHHDILEQCPSWRVSFQTGAFNALALLGLIEVISARAGSCMHAKLLTSLRSIEPGDVV
jgi:hypothetical protein